VVDNEPGKSVAGTPLSIVGGWPGHSCSCRAAVAGPKPLSGLLREAAWDFTQLFREANSATGSRRGASELASCDWRWWLALSRVGADGDLFVMAGVDDSGCGWTGGPVSGRALASRVRAGQKGMRATGVVVGSFRIKHRRVGTLGYALQTGS
jgi:hypothetical protein